VIVETADEGRLVYGSLPALDPPLGANKSKILNRKSNNASNPNCLSPLPPDDRGEY